MKFKITIAVLLMGIGMASSAQAGLIDVKTIEIKHGGNPADGWLQVAEVAALNMGGTNVSLASNGATASAPDTWDGSSVPANAIDGIQAAAFPSMFHEGSPLTFDTLTITLATVQELNSIQIWGRTDCCSSRDIYDITFKNMNGDFLFMVDDLSAANNDHTGFALLPNTALNHVPEPASMALLGLGLLGLGVVRRNRRA